MSEDASAFITVDQLTPASTRVNLRLKVAEVRAVCSSGACRVAEVLVGDATGVIGMLVTDRQIDVMQPGGAVVLRGAHVVVLRNTMRLCVNPEFGLCQPLSKDDPSAPQLSMDIVQRHNLSHVEYELVSPPNV